MKRQQQQQLLTSFLLFSACIALVLLFVTNRHHDDRPHDPVVLATSAKVAKAVAAAQKPVGGKALLGGKQIGAKQPPAPMSAEEKIENILKQNLDRAAKSLQNAQLRPLLISQGRKVLHSAKNVKETNDMSHPTTPEEQEHHDLHSALKSSQNSNADDDSNKQEHDDGVSGVEDRTEQALRHQLDMETHEKEKEMFQNALKQEHAHVANFGPNSGKAKGDVDKNFKKTAAGKEGVSESTVNEEQALKAQLEASTKRKQKEMYQEAFKDWLEKQQQVKFEKAKTQVKIAAREKQLFKKTLDKAKEEGPSLHRKLKEEEEEADSGHSKKSAKPSFSTWLKAFKRQLAHRTAEASKKIAVSHFIKAATGGKPGTPQTHAAPNPQSALEDAAERRQRAERAVKELEKSLKLEQKEEKVVKHDEDSEHTPGKALALLKRTMAKEREALKEISKDESGAEADPNLVSLVSKKAAKPKEHNGGILGLDDLDYF